METSTDGVLRFIEKTESMQTKKN